MPWELERQNGQYCVIKSSSGQNEGCHATREEALDHMRALYSAEDDANHAPVVEEAPVIVLDPEPTIDVETPDPEIDNLHWAGDITFEGIYTGDGRLFREGSVTWNDELLPVPFKWQRTSAEGHLSSVTIGRVDSIQRLEGGKIYGSGVILAGPDAPPEAAQYVALMNAGAAGGVSIDGDSAEFEIIEDIENPYNMRMEFTKINIRALTAVDIPAFAGAQIRLAGTLVADAFNFVSTSQRPTYAEIESMVASLVPVDPPAEWFESELKELTPINITEVGRVFGHLAGKDTCHIGYGSCTTAPMDCDYDSYFHLGCLKTAEGDEINVGHMTFKGSHAPLDLGAQAAAAHYDSTSLVSADIRVGNDEFGIWVAGALRPGLSDEDVREIRSAPLSGDWRPVNRKLQLIAAHAVNVPGFPVPRVRGLVASGVTEALIVTEDCNCQVAEEYALLLFELDIQEEN